jgi:hypothetical protein
MTLFARVLLGLVLVAGAAPEAARAQLQAGAAVRTLTLPEGVPLAGYSGRRAALPDVLGQHDHAHYFPPCGGGHDGQEIRAKALVLARPSVPKLVFVSLDTVGVDAPLRKLITDSLELPPLSLAADHVLISATHTHSGPGALTENHFLEYAATDRIHEGFRDDFASQVVGVVKEAVQNLAAAELFHFAVNAPSLHTNRSRDPGHGDHRLSVLAARNASGSWIGALVNFAVHGTAHRDDNNRLSADFPGAMERAFAKAMGAAVPGQFPVVFLNGAEGDVIPTSKPPTMQADLDAFASTQWGAWTSAAPAPLPDAAWKVATLDVPVGRPFMYLRSELKPLQEVFPFSRLGIELATYFPAVAKIWSIRLGDLRFMTIPGEPTTDLGLELRGAAEEIGITSAWILGLTNDHLGYFTSRADWKVAEYESGASVYGAYASRRLVNGHLHLLRP